MPSLLPFIAGFVSSAFRGVAAAAITLLPACSSPQVRASLLTTQPFGDTFGPNRKRKRPKLAADTLAELAATADRHVDKCAYSVAFGVR